MIIEEISLNQFRNYYQFRHQFSTGLNLFVGKNGEGKTNLLESIYYLSHFNSFRTQQLENLSQDRKKTFSILLKFNDEGEKKTLQVIHQSNKTEIRLNQEKIKSQNLVQGNLKVILFTVRDLDLVLLSPSLRREFFDQTISMMKSEYSELLRNYQKLIKLRNQQLKKGSLDKQWDDMIITLGTKVVYARNSFLKAILPLFRNIFKLFNAKKYPIEILYRLGNNKGSDLAHPEQFKITEEYYTRWLEEKQPEDKRRGFTTFGPHADDYIFQMTNQLCKDNASQGELRLYIYTLKLAIYEYFKKVIKKTPILLLDDVFNDFDQERIQKFFAYLQKQEQVMVSSANQHLITPYLSDKVLKTSLFKIDSGKIIP